MKKQLFIGLLVANLFCVTACKEYYQVHHIEAGYTSIDSSSAHDSTIIAIQAPYQRQLDDLMNEWISNSDNTYYTSKPQGTLGNWVCDLVLHDYLSYPEAEIINQKDLFVLFNTRGLRATLDSGKVVLRDIFEIMPFENEIVFIKMPESSFLTVARFLVESGGHPISHNVQVIAEKDSLLSFTLNKQQPKTDYWIITTDYLADGGDNMDFFKFATQRINTGVKLRDAIANHCRAQFKLNQTLHAELDERTLFFR